jgi:hypothetical protein
MPSTGSGRATGPALHQCCYPATVPPVHKPICGVQLYQDAQAYCATSLSSAVAKVAKVAQPVGSTHVHLLSPGACCLAHGILQGRVEAQ